MEDQNSGISDKDWYIISETLQECAQFLNETTDTLKKYQKIVDEEFDFLNRIKFIDKTEQSMRDLLVAKNRFVLYERKMRISDSIPSDWQAVVSDMTLCMNSAVQKLNSVCNEILEMRKDSKSCEDKSFDD